MARSRGQDFPTMSRRCTSTCLSFTFHRPQLYGPKGEAHCNIRKRTAIDSFNGRRAERGWRSGRSMSPGKNPSALVTTCAICRVRCRRSRSPRRLRDRLLPRRPLLPTGRRPVVVTLPWTPFAAPLHVSFMGVDGESADHRHRRQSRCHQGSAVSSASATRHSHVCARSLSAQRRTARGIRFGTRPLQPLRRTIDYESTIHRGGFVILSTHEKLRRAQSGFRRRGSHVL